MSAWACDENIITVAARDNTNKSMNVGGLWTVSEEGDEPRVNIWVGGFGGRGQWKASGVSGAMKTVDSFECKTNLQKVKMT